MYKSLLPYYAQIFAQRYRGIRPAPSYPACPDHKAKPPLFELLGAQASTGIQLTESFAMFPAAAGWGHVSTIDKTRAN